VSRPFATKDSLLSLMSEGKPRSTREVTERLGVTARAAECACCRYRKAGLLLRSEKPLGEANRVFAGRAGTSYNTPSFYLFVLGNGAEEAVTDSVRFLSHSSIPRTMKPNKDWECGRFMPYARPAYSSLTPKVAGPRGRVI